MKKIISFGKEFVSLYVKANFPRASAAMSYFLTMTFFPLIVCLYSLLGNSYEKAMRVLRFLENFMTAETVEIIQEFLIYVARNHSTAMLIAGLTLLLTSSSAAFRSLQSTIGDMQGRRRYNGFWYFGFSVVFSLLFVAAIYIGIAVMLTSRVFIERLSALLPFIDVNTSWNQLRFVVFGGYEFVMFLLVFSQCCPTSGSYKVWVGALVATLANVVVSIAFSIFIGASAKYSLVYGSITSVVLLMLWLYVSCMVICCGAAVNIVIERLKKKQI